MSRALSGILPVRFSGQRIVQPLDINRDNIGKFDDMATEDTSHFDQEMTDQQALTDNHGGLNDTSDLRRMSAVLSTFPWSTDFIVHDIKRIFLDGPYSAYIDSILQVETDVESQEVDNIEPGPLEVALCRVKPGSSQFPSVTNLKRGQALKLCELLCAYRFIDVLYTLHESGSTDFERPMYPKWRISRFLPNQFWPLHDWVALLLKAKASVDSLNIFKIPEHPSDDDSDPSVLPTVSLTRRLLKDLCALSTNQEAIKLLSNIQLAALHVACMMRGTAGLQDRLAVPNIPSRDEEWDAQMFSEEEAGFVRDLIKASELHKIRHPLYGALLYSPLYLLSGRKLTSNTWDQDKMLKLAKALGNTKPAILVETEKLLWASVLDIASGKVHCYSALKTFFSKVDWDAIAMVSEADRAHFADDKSLPESSGQLVSFEGETFLPASWPLAPLRRLIVRQDDKIINAAHESSSLQDFDDMDVDKADPIPPAAGVDGPSIVRQDDVTLDDNLALSAGVKGSSDYGVSSRGNKASLAKATDKATVQEGTSSKIFKSVRLQGLYVAGKLGSATEVKGTTSAVQRSRRSGKRAVKRGNAEPQQRLAKVIAYQQVEEGVFVQQVRVKTIEKPSVTFRQNKTRNRVSGSEVTIFDASGHRHTWIPEFHFESDLATFRHFFRLVEKNYVEGKPRYLSDPDSSYISVVPYADFKAMTADAVQCLLRKKHIVISDHPIELVVPTDKVNFDEAGLQLLKNLEASIEFQDQSIPVKDDYKVQLCTGTLEHVLASAETGGAIVSALSFPLPLSEIRKSTVYSDVEAWLVTEGLPYCDQEALYPTADMRWGLASTTGARHWIHIDCDGLGTVVDVVCGGRWWLLFTPQDPYELSNFGDTDQFFFEFDVTRPPAHWTVEAVYLRPGTRLIMKPNTPHSVFTIEHSIAFGGHFYSFGDIQQTFFGLVHAFVMDTLVTNTEHPRTRVLLLRMMQYLYKFYVEGADAKRNAAVHLPILGDDMSVFVDVLTLCNFCILSNFLDPRTYNFPGLPYGDPARPTHLSQRIKYDYNALSPDDRHYFSYVRGLALNLINWVHCRYVFVDRENHVNDFTSIARGYLHRHVRSIVAYKAEAEKRKFRGIPNCSVGDLRRQATLLFSNQSMPEFQGLSLKNLDEPRPLGWRGRYTPKMQVRPLEFSERDALVLGTTPGDKMFHEGSARGFPASDSSVRGAGGSDEDDEDDNDNDNDNEKEVENSDNDGDGDNDDNDEAGGRANIVVKEEDVAGDGDDACDDVSSDDDTM